MFKKNILNTFQDLQCHYTTAIYIYMYMSSSLISAKLSPTEDTFFFFKKCICLNRITKCLTYVIENRSESFILFYFILFHIQR